MFDTLTIMIPPLKSIQNIDKINKYKKIYKKLVKNKEDGKTIYSLKLVFKSFSKIFSKNWHFQKKIYNIVVARMIVILW